MEAIVACLVQARLRVRVGEVVVADVDDNLEKVRMPSGLHRHCPARHGEVPAFPVACAQSVIGAEFWGVGEPQDLSITR